MHVCKSQRSWTSSATKRKNRYLVHKCHQNIKLRYLSHLVSGESVPSFEQSGPD